MKIMNHYKWLEANFGDFLQKLDLDPEWYMSLIGCHGDKCYQYKNRWEEANVPFYHGVAIYLISYVSPYESECRQTKEEWVDPCEWVISNYERFKSQLNPIGGN